MNTNIKDKNQINVPKEMQCVFNELKKSYDEIIDFAATERFPGMFHGPMYDLEMVCNKLKIDFETAKHELVPNQIEVYRSEEGNQNGYLCEEDHVLVDTNGIYYLILLSQTPFGERIKRWIADDVLGEVFWGGARFKHKWNKDMLKLMDKSFNIKFIN
jgi:hypothetical protein